MSSVTFGVLGPIEAADERGPIRLKGARHRAVLARLLVARGRVVPVERLADDLWDDPPRGAVGAIRTFVGELRRALEPDRPPRSPARLLVTVGPGYALRTPPGSVDARRFETALEAAGRLLEHGAGEAAVAEADGGLSLWRGPAYAEFADTDWARADAARLGELRTLAVDLRARALLALGRAAEAVPDLEAQTTGHPWREESWRLLALALYRSGRQGDALAALRRARAALAEELGVDPGPELRRLETDILARSPSLEGPRRAGPRRTGRARPFVGRVGELARLEEVADGAVSRRALGVALVSGDAGEGKTTLAEALTGRLEERGWTAAWGRGPEQEGAPGLWPWTQVLTSLDRAGHPTPPEVSRTVGDPDRLTPGEMAATRFRSHRAVADHLARIAGTAPLLLVLDDLQWSGEETLSLLAFLAGEGIAAPVAVVGTYRATEIGPSLAEALGRLARVEPARVHLGGLDATAVGEILRAALDGPVDAATVRAVHRRTGGNPFYTGELARLLRDEGPAALDSVPAGVRDVVRRRVARLPQASRGVLGQAAVVGREVDMDVLSALVGEEEALRAVESAQREGVMVDAGPERARFAHDLVRDALREEVASVRRARSHARIAEVVERLRPHDADALAHHYVRAGNNAARGKAVRYAREAAGRAERAFAPHEAARLWRGALTAHDREAGAGAAEGGGDTEGTGAAAGNAVRERLDLVMGLVRALAFTGDLESARRHRGEAVAMAEELGDPLQTAAVLGAFDVPAIWTANDDEALSQRVGAAAERTLAALPERFPAQRCRLLATVAMELRGVPGGRGRSAAHAAETIARELDDPELLAFALNARFMHAFERPGSAGARADLGTELVGLARRHSLVGFEVLGRLILLQAHAALADLDTADGHAAAADRLAEEYGIPLVGVFTEWYAALRLAVAGRVREAEAAYRSASGGLRRSGMRGMERGLSSFALLCLRIQSGEGAGAALAAGEAGAAGTGPLTPWVRALDLASRGELTAAAETLPADSPPDLLREARTVLAALVALRTGDRAAMERAHASLLPAAGELAGAQTGLLTLGPVAGYLGALAEALGRPDEAERHRRRALAVAERAGAPHWAAAARRALGLSPS
ncbi:BTAD domain-containing putative transcriptional regulator [Nocardiopsis lucentensis]|uniref:BTAD domain-containing putative transcriptional regulator n=1 Tax=Nocardiopsis lucentensis TaxID=53441 RepID=UPI001F4CE7E2|nr:BTAD domain-containing putative transcriptional regulator [Nocardiopsis lucentensis]